MPIHSSLFHLENNTIIVRNDKNIDVGKGKFKTKGGLTDGKNLIKIEDIVEIHNKKASYDEGYKALIFNI